MVVITGREGVLTGFAHAHARLIATAPRLWDIYGGNPYLCKLGGLFRAPSDIGSTKLHPAVAPGAPFGNRIGFGLPGHFPGYVLSGGLNAVHRTLTEWFE